jgi:hypothetical protein
LISARHVTERYIAAVPLDIVDPLTTAAVLDAHLVALQSSIEHSNN